ncbi:hypothetical protein D4R75_11130, partial [bacterium]
MKTIKILIRTAFCFLLLWTAPVFCQENGNDPDDPTGALRAQLTNVVRARFGNDYEVAFSVLDSALARNKCTSRFGEITDPYGTLRGFVLFAADKSDAEDSDHGIMGLYKDGQIVWSTNPILKGTWYGTFATRDINQDGRVEILVEWTPGSQIMVSHLWIISWDGLNGSVINQIDPRSGSSTIHATESMFELISTDTLSAMVIRGYWPEEETFSYWFPNIQVSTMPYVTYSWDGQQYGLWSTTRQIGRNEWLPANLLRVTTSCRVAKADSLRYQYTIKNSAQSRQPLRAYALSGLCQDITVSSSAFWEYWGYMSNNPIAYWAAAETSSSQAVKPGKSINIALMSKRLPSIVRFYGQGQRPALEATPANVDPNAGSQFITDLLSNSFQGVTIGPTDTLSPFIPLNFLDTLGEYTTQSRSLGWIKDQPTSDKYVGYFSSAKASLLQNNTASARATLQRVLLDVNVDSTANLTSEAYALIRYNTEYLLGRAPSIPPPAPGLSVKLVNSTGTKLTGGSLQYYDGTWKDATNNNDGAFSIATSLKTLSLRMTYEFGTQTKSNVTVGYDTVAFQTVNAQVKLQNSQGTSIDTGTVQYYSGAWRNLGTTATGVASKELLPGNYSFRMTYAYGSNDKQQDIGTIPVVVFQTVNTTVQLQNSQGSPMDQGIVQYYSGAWRVFGATTNGAVSKELLPNNYSFRMTYAFAGNDKQQNIGTNPTVVFQTVNATVQLKNSQGNFIDQGTVQYYFSSWNNLGVTTNGVAAKELLPGNYTLRMTYEFATNDKQQNIGTNPAVVFQTVNAIVQLRNSQGAPIDTGRVQYYLSSWKDLGVTSNGAAAKELLPANYTFRMTHESVT